MTSHDASRRDYQDQLDIMIRWALHKSVDNATPPNVWEQICERLGVNEQARTRTRMWQSFLLTCKALILWLLDGSVSSPAEFAYCYGPRPHDAWDKDHLFLLIYPCGLPMLLDQAV